MVIGLAFFATAVSTWFAQATLVRFTQRRRPHDLAWTIALTMFAVASAALAVGAATGWDPGTFRVFYAFGAIVNVPWLALGTIFLLAGPNIGRRIQWGLVAFTGFALGALLVAPIAGTWPSATIPVGKEVFGALPRILAAVGSSVGALVLFGGAAWSAIRLLRGMRTSRIPGITARRLAGANGCIALGTLILSSGGLLQGAVGHDQAFAITLALGITVIYLGFTIASPRTPAPADRATDPKSSVEALSR
ncbi:MAG: hypothetical protein ACOYN3_10225 [Acidimicrobiia bacterium]